MTCGFFIYKVSEPWKKDYQRVSSRDTLNSAGILSENMYTLSIYSSVSTWKCYSCQDSFPVQSSNPTPHCLVHSQIRRGDLSQLHSTTYTLGAWVRIPLEATIYASDLSVCCPVWVDALGPALFKQLHQTALKGRSRAALDCNVIRTDTLAEYVYKPSWYMTFITEVGTARTHSNLNRHYHDRISSLEICSTYMIRTLVYESSRHGDVAFLVLTALNFFRITKVFYFHQRMHYIYICLEVH
jgi:hypothetical protein